MSNVEIQNLKIRTKNFQKKTVFIHLYDFRILSIFPEPFTCIVLTQIRKIFFVFGKTTYPSMVCFYSFYAILEFQVFFMNLSHVLTQNFNNFFFVKSFFRYWKNNYSIFITVFEIIHFFASYVKRSMSKIVL